MPYPLFNLNLNLNLNLSLNLTLMPLSIHPLIIALVLSRSHMLQPFCIFKVPVNGQAQPFFKSNGRFPSQFFIDLSGINGITPVMPRAVFYISDKLFAGAGWVSLFLSISLQSNFTRSIFFHSLKPPILYVSRFFPL